jgi:hypothetical protein
VLGYLFSEYISAKLTGKYWKTGRSRPSSQIMTSSPVAKTLIKATHHNYFTAARKFTFMSMVMPSPWRSQNNISSLHIHFLSFDSGESSMALNYET